MYRNALTQSAYSGKNQKLLQDAAALAGIESTKVAGFKQWLELGRVVKKGEHGTKLIMVCDKKLGDEKAGDVKVQDSASGEPAKYRVCKTVTVFFESQTTELQQEASAA